MAKLTLFRSFLRSRCRSTYPVFELDRDIHTNYSYTKNEGNRRFISKDRASTTSRTDGRTDGRTDARTHGRTHATEIITLPAKAGGKYNLICIYLILSHIQKCMEVYNYFVLT